MKFSYFPQPISVHFQVKPKSLNQWEERKLYIIIIISALYSLKYCSYWGRWQIDRNRMSTRQSQSRFEGKVKQYLDGRGLWGLSGHGWKKLQHFHLWLVKKRRKKEKKRKIHLCTNSANYSGQRWKDLPSQRHYLFLIFQGLHLSLISDTFKMSTKEINCLNNSCKPVRFSKYLLFVKLSPDSRGLLKSVNPLLTDIMHSNLSCWNTHMLVLWYCFFGTKMILNTSVKTLLEPGTSGNA